MSAIEQLDAVLTELVTKLFHSVPFQDWKAATVFSKYTPDASVGAHDFDFVLEDGSPGLNVLPPDDALAMVGKLSKRHWRLTQDLGLPRWYKMTVTVERSGKFSVDFEYKDDYKEGDIMQRG